MFSAMWWCTGMCAHFRHHTSLWSISSDMQYAHVWCSDFHQHCLLKSSFQLCSWTLYHLLNHSCLNTKILKKRQHRFSSLPSVFRQIEWPAQHTAEQGDVPRLDIRNLCYYKCQCDFFFFFFLLLEQNPEIPVSLCLSVKSGLSQPGLVHYKFTTESKLRAWTLQKMLSSCIMGSVGSSKFRAWPILKIWISWPLLHWVWLFCFLNLCWFRKNI